MKLSNGIVTIVMYRIVHGASVVPHDYVSVAPTVSINVIWGHRVIVQKAQDGQALKLSHVFEPRHSITWTTNE